jgi:hypothetical protein
MRPGRCGSAEEGLRAGAAAASERVSPRSEALRASRGSVSDSEPPDQHRPIGIAGRGPSRRHWPMTRTYGLDEPVNGYTDPDIPAGSRGGGDKGLTRMVRLGCHDDASRWPTVSGPGGPRRRRRARGTQAPSHESEKRAGDAGEAPARGRDS